MASQLEASDAGPRVYAASLEHVLVIENAKGEVERIALASDSAAGSDYARLRRTKYALRVSDDGRALIHSNDGGQTWRFVGFEPGIAPYSCAHVTFSGDDPFASAPSIRELALEVLACSARPGVSTGRSHVELPWHDEQYEGATCYVGLWNLDEMADTFVREFRLAFEYARVHHDDVELRQAAARALLLPGGQFGRGTQPLVLAAVSELALVHDDVRAILLPALDIDDPFQYRALQVLVDVPDHALDQRFLKRIAAALDDDDAARILQNTWVVARRVGAGFHSLAPSAVELLERVASLPEDAPHSCFHSAVRLAIVTLARVGASEALERIAAGPQRIYATSDWSVLNEHSPIPATARRWSLDIGELSTERQHERTVYSTAACWARVALSKLPP